MTTICKDWRKINKLFLVYPSMRSYLISEFIGLIKCISNTLETELNLILIIPKEYEINFEKEIDINSISINLKIDYWNIEANDIWCRDYNPFSICEENEVKLAKALYQPSYGFNTAMDNNIGTKIIEKFSNNIPKYLPFKLDGGNIISNEKYIFISDKLFSENWNLTDKQLKNYFSKYFNSKLIIIPTESLDQIGHVDSICRFLSEKVILLPIYEDEFKTDNRYINEVYSLLIKELPMDYEFIFLPCKVSDQISDENIISSAGCFLNYFRIENNLYFPSFEGMEKEQKEIRRILRQHDKKLNIYFCEANNLSAEGGIFNCITSTIYV